MKYLDSHQHVRSTPDPELRYGLSKGIMPIMTLHRLMRAHEHHPGHLRLYSNRFGPAETLAGIMDYDQPRRLRRDGDPLSRVTLGEGWTNDDEQVRAIVMNVPANGYAGWGGYVTCLKALLNFGCIYPGTALDDWLATEPGGTTDSRTECLPEFRMFKVRT